MLLEEYIRRHYRPVVYECSIKMLSDDICQEEDQITTTSHGICSKERISVVSSNKLKRLGAEEFLKNLPDLKPTGNFPDLLLRWMNKKELTAPQVYKACNMTRSAFNQHINGKRYPSKDSVLALCIGLKLTLREANNFIEEAGYSLSPMLLRDVIVQYFLCSKIYDIDIINIVLCHKEEEPLTGKS